MKIIIENIQDKINTGRDIEELIERAVGFCLEAEGFTFQAEISFLLCDDEKIQELNREYRKIDAPTDVLSFPMAEVVEGTLQDIAYDFDMDGELIMLGDIAISLETAERQALEYGHSFFREVAFLTTHGVFHLLGYDHETEEEENIMLRKQEDVLEKLELC